MANYGHLHRKRVNFQWMPREMTGDVDLPLPEWMVKTMFEYLPHVHQTWYPFKSNGWKELSVFYHSVIFLIIAEHLSKSLPNIPKFVINFQVEIFQWEIFDCRNIWKPLESIAIHTVLQFLKSSIYRFQPNVTLPLRLFLFVYTYYCLWKKIFKIKINRKWTLLYEQSQANLYWALNINMQRRWVLMKSVTHPRWVRSVSARAPSLWRLDWWYNLILISLLNF